MNIKRIHDFCFRRLLSLLLITFVVGYFSVGLGTIVEQNTDVKFVLPPTTIIQAGFGIFVAGFVTIIFIPIYWLQMKLMGYVTKKIDFIKVMSVANAYLFAFAILLFILGFFVGYIAVPVFMITPGVYFSLWLFKKLFR